jgi:hypothetical protein
MIRLTHAYPETYKELLEQEKVNDEATGIKWVPIDGDTSLIVSVRTIGGGEDTTGESTGSYKEDEGNNGGEA